MKSAGRFVVKGRGADVVEHAVRAVRPARLAYAATVEDKQVGEDGTVLFGNYSQEVLLYLFRVSVLGETEPVRDAPDVGVHDDALVHAESVAEDHVGRLAAYPWEGDELHHGARNLPAVLLEQGTGHTLQGAGF